MNPKKKILKEIKSTQPADTDDKRRKEGREGRKRRKEGGRESFIVDMEKLFLV